MVLSDRDIEDALLGGSLIATPLDDLPNQIQPCSIDLRLAGSFKVLRGGNAYQSLELKPGEEFWIGSHDFVLASTVETVALPDDLLGTLSGRSSVGRLGVQVENAGFIDPGFSGQITLELYNMAPKAVPLTVGMRIVQLALWRTSSPCRRPYGHPGRASKYQNQSGATRSALEGYGATERNENANGS